MKYLRRRYLLFFVPTTVEFAATLLYMVYQYPGWIVWTIHGLAWVCVTLMWVAARRHRRRVEEAIKWIEAWDRLTRPAE